MLQGLSSSMYSLKSPVPAEQKVSIRELFLHSQVIGGWPVYASLEVEPIHHLPPVWLAVCSFVLHPDAAPGSELSGWGRVAGILDQDRWAEDKMWTDVVTLQDFISEVEYYFGEAILFLGYIPQAGNEGWLASFASTEIWLVKQLFY